MKAVLAIVFLIVLGSCVGKKAYISVNDALQKQEKLVEGYKNDIRECKQKLSARSTTIATLNAEFETFQQEVKLKNEQLDDLKSQIVDLKKQRDQQLAQVGDLTVLSKKASDNISETIKQMEKKDKYISRLQHAKTTVDSTNIALALNLKKELQVGIQRGDIHVKVDKTIVFISLSDKLLYDSGSSIVAAQAKDILAKIAEIVKNNPQLDIMVEANTDNASIRSSCIVDNWDYSVKRSTAVIRVLQNEYDVNPNILIAAGRSAYSNEILEDKIENNATNRRTRIVLLPRVNQFYELIAPSN